MNDARWTRGGHRGGGVHVCSNNILDFIIECSIARQDPWRSRDWEYFAWPLRNSLTYPSLPSSLTLCPCYVIRCSGFSHILPLFFFRVLNTNQRTKSRGGLGTRSDILHKPLVNRDVDNFWEVGGGLAPRIDLTRAEFIYFDASKLWFLHV